MNHSNKINYSLFTCNEQKLQLSLAMKQSLDVLHMPIDELSLWVEEQIRENPLLNWKNIPLKKSSAFSEIDIAYEPSLFEYLMNQAREHFSENEKLLQMQWLIGNLDETGFFTQDLEDAPKEWKIEDLKSLLGELQEFDPPGIGAKNLQESLLFQLKAIRKENTLSYFLIEKCLDDLLAGKLSSIQKKYQLEEKKLHEAIYSEIASLDPFPGLRFQKKATTFIIPDLLFIEENESWSMEINEENLPSFCIDEIPKDLSSIDKVFCKKHLSQAKQLWLMVEKRKHTLYRVGKYMAEIQIDYLREESSSLVPLTIRDIAEKLEIHESTVSRAIHGKHLSCNWGTIPLKSLLSKHLTQETKSVSSDQALKLLQKLIAEESKKKPLSDRELLEKMKEVGMPCSRRTVTKYRQSLHIPSRRFRKKIESF